MIICDLDKNNTISFDLEMKGVESSDNPKVFLAVDTGSSKVSFEASKSGAGFSVTIPPLEGFLDAKTYSFEINIKIGNRIFVPYNGELKFNFDSKSLAAQVTNVSADKKENERASQVPSKKQEKPEVLVQVQEEKTPVQKQSSKSKTAFNLISAIDKDSQVKESVTKKELPKIKSNNGLKFTKGTITEKESEVSQKLVQEKIEQDSKKVENKPVIKFSKAKVIEK